MSGFYRYTTECGDEVVCIAANIAMYDTLCGNDLHDEGKTGTGVVELDKAVVTCPHCIEVINAVLDLPQSAKRQARKSRAGADGEK
jgi:hypothetical protein